ncbi:ABC transporter ATP-binding protein [Candidatus Entotheonella palauensis]|uniref:ABC transporter n=1 Tax=Candidatus Entotheonella gemina TaxID=1429439 RepID=W4ME37_9BACT|nr:ABC transporter ATP-binding protein [Candidatus Entotheonella palauensis]ETX08445.1 MAG: hypothetical protein ETSY2_05375 [Candidatus Entotheonella gemina]
MIFVLFALAGVYTIAKSSKDKAPQSLGPSSAQDNTPVLNGPLLPSLRVHPIARLYKELNLTPRRMTPAVIASIVSTLCNLLSPLSIGLILHTVVAGRNSILSRLGIVTLRSQILTLGAVALAAQAADLLLEYYQRKKWREISRSLEHDLRLKTVAHVQRLDLAYIENQRSGQLKSVIAGDTTQVNRFFESGVDEIMRMTMTFVIVGAVFFALAPSLALLALLPQPLLLWGFRHIQRRIGPRYQELGEKTDEFGHLLTNNLAGLTTVKSFTAEDYEVERMANASEAVRRVNVEAVDTSAFYSYLMRMMLLGTSIVILTLTSLFVVVEALSFAAFIVITYFTMTFIQTTRRLDESYDLYKRTIASIERIFQLLDTEIAIPTGRRRLPLKHVRGDITFDHVIFEYNPSVKVLTGISLHANSQETLAIVGVTGSGKTTLVKLLLRFYDVNAGAIRLDGVNIRELSIQDLRNAIGLVSQDAYLFHGTVYDNIVYGRRTASFDEVVMAARLAEAHDFIEQLPEGYRTVVGERGEKLSGGQRQRLSIARAVLKAPPILILDEATSALDYETEAAIQRSFQRLSAHRTTIIISHRLSTVRHADRIYVMDAGKVHEQGNHTELLDQDGIYANLWRMQTGDVFSDKDAVIE